MFTRLRTYAAIILLLLTTPALAKEITRITLDNGATVQLNDDYTWEYVILTNQVAPTAEKALTPTKALTNTPTQQTTAAINNTETISNKTLVNTKATLTQSAIAQAALLKSTAKNDVKIEYVNSQWDDDRLGLTFKLNSNSPEHFVMIALEISFFADSGQLLAKKTVKVWKAIFRMPETYLRKGETRNSKIIWIDGIDKAQWSKQLMSLKVKKMDSRM